MPQVRVFLFAHEFLCLPCVRHIGKGVCTMIPNFNSFSRGDYKPHMDLEGCLLPNTKYL